MTHEVSSVAPPYDISKFINIRGAREDEVKASLHFQDFV